MFASRDQTIDQTFINYKNGKSYSWFGARLSILSQSRLYRKKAASDMFRKFGEARFDAFRLNLFIWFARWVLPPYGTR